MSLKAFHVVFVVAATLCAATLGAWGVWDYARTGRTANLVVGLVGFAFGALLVRYSFWFVKKLKKVSWQ